MNTTNKTRNQAIIKAGFLLAAVLMRAVALAQQSHGTGSEVVAETATRRIVVSIPDRKLAFIENGILRKTFPVAVGKQSTPSPSGSFRVVSRIVNPTYYHEGTVVPPGPANPVGTRWMGLSEHGYGIHGTNAPASIGKAASHGCIRMARNDLEQLFAMVRVGDAVEIRAERDELTARLFGTDASTVLAAVSVGTQSAGQ